jgi:hypothetical protein
MVKVINQNARQLLADVPDANVFYLNDGRILRNMEDLRDALDSMSDDLFLYHNNTDKNDFYNWVKDIIGDDKLSHDLLRSHSSARAFKSVSQRVALLKSKIR